MTQPLEKRIAELSLEIRQYPTPIARCDEQLIALIDERARLIAELKQSEENDGGFNAA
jgi:chorismate mutase